MCMCIYIYEYKYVVKCLDTTIAALPASFTMLPYNFACNMNRRGYSITALGSLLRACQAEEQLFNITSL